MDVDAFKNTESPGKRRSQLEPFAQGIFDLKRSGYTDDQIRQWLGLNGVLVSREAVRAFMKRRPESVGTLKAKPDDGVRSTQAGKAGLQNRPIADPADIRKAKDLEIDFDDYR